MTNVLLVGNGAREHVIAEALKKNPGTKLYSFMKAKNPGIACLSEEFEMGKLDDAFAIKQFAKRVKADFAVIGPEAPLEAGVVDVLESAGIRCVGPKKELARLETSKSFTRNLVEKYNIPGNSQYRVFTSMSGVRAFMEDLDGQFVVKAEGLCGGKGVKVVGDHLQGVDDGVAYAEECIERDGMVVVEEKFVGQEFSLMSFCDGINVKDMPPVQDHKRAFVGDKGPNTGGMGSYSDSNHLLPFITEDDLKQAHAINQAVAGALLKECGDTYKGILYGGFIATKDGVKLIEYNARFGDPEAMNVIPIMKTDFTEVCKAVVNGTLNQIDLEFSPKATVCKYAVPMGYPDNPKSGEKVVLDAVSPDAKVYYASVDQKDDGLYMTTSRAIGFVGIADSLDLAEQIAENAVKAVQGEVFHREDIGTKELVQKRIDHMKELRG